MKANELVGKLAIRTKSNSNGDLSYTSNPLRILKATDSHIIYQYPEDNHMFNLVGNDKPHILNIAFCDDNWVDYEELMNI